MSGRPNLSGRDWNDKEQVRAYHKAYKLEWRKKYKYVMEDFTGFRVPEWVLPPKQRKEAYKLKLLRRVKIER